MARGKALESVRCDGSALSLAVRFKGPQFRSRFLSTSLVTLVHHGGPHRTSPCKCAAEGEPVTSMSQAAQDEQPTRELCVIFYAPCAMADMAHGLHTCERHRLRQIRCTVSSLCLRLSFISGLL